MAWFRKKSKKPEAGSEPASLRPELERSDAGEAGALIQRWDSALADLRRDFGAVLAEATAGSEPLIAATESDLTPLTLPWNTIEVRRREFGERLSDKWDELGDLMSECDAFTHEMMDREGSKRDAALVELEISYLGANRSVMARAADRIRQIALVADASQRKCQYCGAQLDRVTPVSEALNVECGYCNAMNTVEPGNALRMFAAMGAPHLAEQAAFPDLAAMMRAENQMHQYRESKDVPLRLLEEFESSARRYHTTRLTVEAGYNPEQAKYVETKLARYMKDAHKTLKHYWQWRQSRG